MTPDKLTDAVAAGIIDAAQADRLRSFLGDAPPPAAADPDDETFRLILGFNDIFVSIGILLIIAALIELASLDGAPLIVGACGGLAEVFTRQRRMALPSILLSIFFVLASGMTVVWLQVSLGFADAPSYDSGLLVLAALAMTGAALWHFRRFRVPIDVALAAGSAYAASFYLLTMFVPSIEGDARALRMALLFYGGALFARAMRYDMSDPDRRTIRADIAFWLHLGAAPLLIHGLLGGTVLGGRALAEMDAGVAVGILLRAALIAVVALIVDRRAMIVSSMIYVGFAIYRLIGAQSGYFPGSVILILGLAVLGLSVWWRPLRVMTLAALPDSAFKRGLPPPRP